MTSPLPAGWLGPRLSTELRLLIDCTIVNFAEAMAPDAIPADSDINWHDFVDLARRHRVEGLAWHGLRRLEIGTPAAAMSDLASAARGIAENGLRAALLSSRLRDSFAESGVPLLFLKGLVVGALAYGDPFRKNAWDVDVYVPLAWLGRAARLLRDMGFRPIYPSGDDDTIRQWHRLSKESLWLSADGRLHIELHTALTDHASLLQGLVIPDEPEFVVIAPGNALPTLPRKVQFAYLCVHGASSAWFRLKWIADLVGMVGNASEGELRDLLETARLVGAGRTGVQALLLASWLYPIWDPDGPLAKELRANRLANWLAKRSLRLLLGPEPTARLLGTLAIHLTQMVLTDRLSDGVKEFGRQLKLVRDRRGFLLQG